MRREARLRRAPSIAALGATLVALAAGPTRAQVVPPAPEPGRPWRALAVGDLALPARWAPSLAGGGLVQVALRRERVATEEGFAVVRPPAWYLHAATGLGISFDEDGDGDTGLAAFLGMGLVRRVDPTPISVAGVLVERRWGPEGFAAAARVEVLDNVGAELGWIFVDDGDDGVFVSVDWMRCLLADLGLGPCLP